MDLLLVRHAKSAHDYSRWKTDDIRPLAPNGRARQEKASQGMRKLGLEFNHIWVSPFTRARQTLEIILDAYELSTEPEVVDELKVWGDPHRVQTLLESFYGNHPDAQLLLVGHNPNMSDLAEILTGVSIYMRTSDLVHIRRSSTGFSLVKYYPRSELMKL